MDTQWGLTPEFAKTPKISNQSRGSAQLDRNDQKWRSRVRWLYRQFPLGAPDTRTFHQQPFSELVLAYQQQGDTNNLISVLSERMSIEFRLAAKRLWYPELTFYSVVSLITYIAFVLGEFWAQPVPVFIAFLLGCSASIAISGKRMRAKTLLCLLLFGILVSGQTLFFEAEYTNFFPTELLFFVTTIFGFLPLLVWCVQLIFWATLKYSLSPLRGIATIMVFLCVGTYGVNKALQHDLLVIDAQYTASAIIHGETQPGMLRLPKPYTDGEIWSQAPAVCNTEVIDPIVFSADVFVPLVDFRQEFRCHIRAPTANDDASSPIHIVLHEKWVDRRQALENARWHPQTWLWIKALYTLLGWVVISAFILAVTQSIRRYTSGGRSQSMNMDP